MSEDRYKHLFENTSDSIFVVDPSNLMILEVNHAAEMLTGYTVDELCKMKFTVLCSFLKEKEREILENPIQIQKIFSSIVNMPIVRKDQNTLFTEGTAIFWENGQSSTVHIFLQELTERRHLEHQLRQAEKLSALGQLISGVAHELNNPLAVISGYSQLLTMRPSTDEKTKNDLLKIQRESERASRIVQNFLTFARKHPMEKTNVNLNELVEITLELIDYDLRASGVRLVLELKPDLPEVYADLNQLEQVFLNIITNAVHAMEGNSNEKVLVIRTESNETHVIVKFIDSGTGIDNTILGKIFDPFFTTKEVGVGTGLGLSISYSIVKEHAGNIYAKNNPDKGASFIIELPITVKKKPTRTTEHGGMGLASFTRQKPFDILVVDDETSIQDVFKELLTSFSCKVQCASNGLQAMKLLEHQEFDLVLCDLKMPGMDGRRLFESIKEVKPQMASKFVFLTGDTNSSKAFDFLKEAGNRWMAKPFNFKEVDTVLSEHFHKILSGPKSR